ncbi:APC family permease [Sinorhizobium mexicanum]|uniref:APC family permease n=1 Tax=Sinorhizobium mexicanum TaxID=375549 RepID=A0A859QQ19_9HYPH|nr:APC family permease [Sinorhizobium mexicanum]MBP1881794.1 amino acid transporter [Sinorhizobium mexicanum]QLL61549.1 APC family permease [Sinorhizobium mexicanum]
MDGFATRNVSRAVQEEAGRLTGRLGTWDIIFTVLAFNAPLTVVTNFTVLVISMGNGLGTPVTYLAGALLLALFAVGFTTMAKHVPNAGAYYAYITVGLGKRLGLGSAFLAILCYVLLLMGIYLFTAIVWGQLAKTILGYDALSWWQWALIVWVLVSLFGYCRITLSAHVLTVALIAEVLIVAVWIAVVVYTDGGSSVQTSWLTPRNILSGNIGIGLLFAVTSYAGFEATAVFREEARDPDKTVPRATYGAIAVMATMFAAGSFFLINAIGAGNAVSIASTDPAGAAVATFGKYLGHLGTMTLEVLLCSSTFACALALHNVLARYVYSMGMDGVFLKSFAAVHPNLGSPYKASVLLSAVFLLFIGALIYFDADPVVGYGAFAGAGGLGLLYLLILTSLSVIFFFNRRGSKASVSSWKIRYAPAVSLVAFAVCAALATVNIDLMTGSVELGYALVGFMVLALVGGMVYASHLRRSSPDVFEAIGRQKV